MSWFEYGSLPPKKRRLRKGVWLRVKNIPKPILERANRFVPTRGEIQWVVVQEMRPEGKVLLEFWCCGPRRFFKREQPTIYTVFHLLEQEDPEWICEGDLGRGYKE